MPWRSFSLAMRARRVRPSEKSGFGAVPRFAPVRLSSHRLTISRRGGLCTPGGRHRLDRGMSLLGHGHPPRVMKCLGARLALPCGRTECAPPRKPPFAPSPGFPARPLAQACPPWRGGLRTPVTTAQRQRCLLLATGSSSTHVVEMKCLGVRTALQRGRGDRAPPRKAASTLSPGLSPLGHLTWERPPRGGAGSARLLKNAWA